MTETNFNLFIIMAGIVLAILALQDISSIPEVMPPEVHECMVEHTGMIHCDKQYDYWLSWCRHNAKP